MKVSSVASSNYNNSTYPVKTAADSPSGIAISANMKAQVSGYDVGTDNARDGQNLLNVSDGALGSIADSLQKIRELSLKASNTAIYGDDDIQTMQDEVDQLKQQIQDTAKGTEFNTVKLADGSKADTWLATNPKGTGMRINLEDSTLESLGIKDYDLTSNFDISKIDDAIAKVTSSRTDNAAANNALSYQADYNSIAGTNLETAQSKKDETDIGDYISEMQKDKVMQQYRYFAQKQENNNILSMQRMLM